jgi:tetratricopeptide (TPR) repeat protein
MPTEVEIRLLGPVEVLVGGARVDLGPARQRCALAMLLYNLGQPVTTEALIDGLWGLSAPPNTRNTLYSYLSRLRRALRDTGLHIRRQAGGYLIDAAAGQVDVHRNDLDLWRGEPLSGLPGPWAEQVRAELRRHRLNLLIEWAGRESGEGHAQPVADRLRPAVVEYPLAETLIAHFLRALHALGAHEEANTCYLKTVDRLAEELGAQPGTMLTSAHEESMKDSGLPAVPADFVGRNRELAALEASNSILVITGTGGVGKTALAVTWAHRTGDRFPDGRLYVDLRGYSQAEPLGPIEALAELLRALGVSPEEVPLEQDAATGLYRSLLANRKVLVLLDNASSADQVRPLLPGTASSLALITSRDRMAGLMVAEGARALRLESLDEQESLALLTADLGATRVGAEPHAAQEIAQSCARLPLALRIAAANLRDDPAMTLAEYVSRLRPDSYGPIHAAFDLSYQRLTPELRQLFRLLSLHPGPDLTPDVAAALMETPRETASRQLGRLASAHLIEPRNRGRYMFHDLLRQFAKVRTEQEDAPAVREAAGQRVGMFYVDTADRAAALGAPTLARLPLPQPRFAGPRLDTDAQALDWLDAEHPNLMALALTPPSPEMSWYLSDILRGYVQIRAYHVEWRAVAQSAIRMATEHGDDRAIASAWLSLGYLYRVRELHDLAIHSFNEAKTHAGQGNWPAGTATVLTQLGWVYPKVRRSKEAIDCLHLAIDIAAAAGEPAIEATAHGNLGSAYERLGRLPEALIHLREELRLTRANSASKYREANALSDVGAALCALGDFTEAVAHQEQSIQLATELGASSLEAYMRVRLASTYAEADALDDAVREAQLSMPLAGTLVFRDIEAEACSVLGYVEGRRGHPEPAFRWHEQALRAAEHAGDPRVLTWATTLFAEHSRSIPAAERALTLAKDFEMKVFEARASNAMALACLAAGDTAEATGHATRSLLLSHETGHLPGSVRAQSTLDLIRSA